MSDLWVFGYGSLMWNPGFAHGEAVKARLFGWHRSLCIKSTLYRGTPEKPGLVLGLEKGGSCCGMAFHVAPRDREATIAYLREREMTYAIYREAMVPLRLDDGSGRQVIGLTFIANRGHELVASGLSDDEKLAIIAARSGRNGSNRDYVLATHAHLQELGVHDPALKRFVDRLAALP